MQPFTFVHAADLHLDAVLPAPQGEENSKVNELLASAVFIALERLVDLCIAESASFLVLAGDVFHEGSGSLKANFKLSSAFERLAENNIEVFWAKGNHDFLNKGDAAMSWPANVHVFSAEGERFVAGGGLAEVHGVSHKNRHERANLASKLSGKGELFSVGVLHCAVNGLQGQHAAYAPCTLSDLKACAKDYWALGHVHGAGLLASEPPVVYAGSLQGLHVNESGAHGCYVVSVNAQGVAQPRFVPLAPVCWERLTLDIAEIDDLNALLDFILEQIEVLSPDFSGGADSKLLMLRLNLSGRSPLDATLRADENLSQFVLQLNHALAMRDGNSPCLVRLKDIVLSSSPDIDISALSKNENLVGETVRQAQLFEAEVKKIASEGLENYSDLVKSLQGQPWGEEFLSALNVLYRHRSLDENRDLPSVSELAEMANEAAALCLHLFEVE